MLKDLWLADPGAVVFWVWMVGMIIMSAIVVIIYSLKYKGAEWDIDGFELGAIMFGIGAWPMIIPLSLAILVFCSIVMLIAGIGLRIILALITPSTKSTV